MDHQSIQELRQSIHDCASRGLLKAAKWSSELLLSLPASKRDLTSSQPTMSTPVRQTFPPRLSFGDVPQPSDFATTNFEIEESDILQTAHCFMQSKEFARANQILSNCQSGKGQFMRVYCQYLLAEKKAIREWHKLDCHRSQPALPTNEDLMELLEIVVNSTDPWLLFIKALLLSRISRREEAIEAAIVSIQNYPWNWSTWELLGSCLGDSEEVSSVLPLIPLSADHPLLRMFQVKILNELHCPSEQEISTCDDLLGREWFPDSLWLMSQRACVMYHLHDFGNAEIQFEKIFKQDPYRIDDMDIYSNVLYVTENKIKLAELAHEFLELDKDRPEVCCLVGNHYSLRGEHEKAVRYFRRATELNRTYLAAWTLLGHEYVEMKNSHAAIEAYRRAVDVNRKDYRAWYGLGQAYELLNMHQYALQYFQNATALRPYDLRLWQAQANCFEEVGRYREAIECLQRALISAEPHETAIHLKIAKLYDEIEEYGDSCRYHKRIVEIGRALRKPVQEYAYSAVRFATNQLPVDIPIHHGDYDLAKNYLEEVANSNAEQAAAAAETLTSLKFWIDDVGRTGRGNPNRPIEPMPNDGTVDIV